MQVISPESGLPFSDAGAWALVAECLERGCALTEIVLEKPAGERAYVMIEPVGERSVYMKVQLGNGTILGRSFHYSDPDHD